MFAPKLADTVSGFDPVWFAKLVEIEATHFWFVARNELIVGLVDRFFPGARRYLEIGCGNGAVLQAIATARQWERVVGTDLHTDRTCTRARAAAAQRRTRADGCACDPRASTPSTSPALSTSWSMWLRTRASWAACAARPLRWRDDHRGAATPFPVEPRRRDRASPAALPAGRAGDQAAPQRLRNPVLVVFCCVLLPVMAASRLKARMQCAPRVSRRCCLCTRLQDGPGRHRVEASWLATCRAARRIGSSSRTRTRRR